MTLGVRVCWVAWAALCMAGVEGQADGSFWWQTSTTAPEATTVAPLIRCQCVPYYQCVDGVITTSGVDLIDIRVGSGNDNKQPVYDVETCPELIQICCKIPDGSDLSTTTPAPPVTTTLPPDTPCDCVPLLECKDPNRLVSDGGGDTSLALFGTTISHSKCTGAFSVCCAAETTTTTTTVSLPQKESECICVAQNLCGADGRVITDGGGLINIRFDPGASSSTPLASGGCSDPEDICCLPPPPPTTPTTALPQKESECVCVAQNLCGDDGRVITDGADLINIRFGPGSSSSSPLANGGCRNPEDVCCLPPPPPTTLAPPTSSAAPLPGCGRRNYGGVRVRVLGFGDGESQFGEFPWVAAILTPIPDASPPMLQFVGGGTLIHPRVVLTAAHKVYRSGRDPLVVRLGEWDTQREEEPYPHQDVAVAKVILHEDFNESTLYNDVALLFLEEDVVLRPHVNTICLAEDAAQVDWSKCVINGWGVDAFGTTQFQAIMKSLTLPLVDSNTCQGRLRTTRLGSLFNLHPTFLCAGGEAGKDACKGDGGGPLACAQLSQPGHYLLVGLTAWGVGCGREGLPGVYVNIPHLQSWITTNLQQNLAQDGSHSPLQADVSVSETQQGGGRGQGGGGGGGGGGGREEKRRMNQERREERQREREDRMNQREERRRQREQRRQNRQQNKNAR